jgi:predicted phosphodiesterase
MRFAFDLISDLHVETWDSFDWSGQATSPYCVVAGDVARDRGRLIETLTHLGQCYPGGVFYVDGNEEHKDYLDDLGASYRDLVKDIEAIKNVVYMHDNVVIINGVALLATNSWWTYDFDPDIDFDQCVQFIQDHVGVSNTVAINISGVGYNDANYMINSVRKLQTHKEVAAIVLITHTVPAPWIVSHDLDVVGHLRYNGLGNSFIFKAIDEDTENKIKVWCFGHYHRPVEQNQAGIRFVTNPRGRGQTPWSQNPFYPKRIEIEF